MAANDKRKPLLLKVNYEPSVKKKNPLPQPLPMQPPTHLTSPPPPPDRPHPLLEKWMLPLHQQLHHYPCRGTHLPGARGGFGGSSETNKKKKKVLHKLILREYNFLGEMATDLNGGHKSDLVKKI